MRKKDLVNFDRFFCANYLQVCITYNAMESKYCFQATYLLVNYILSKKMSNFQVHASDTGPCSNLSAICHQWRLGSQVLLLKKSIRSDLIVFSLGCLPAGFFRYSPDVCPLNQKTSYANVNNFCLCSNESGIPPFTFDCLQLTYINISLCQRAHTHKRKSLGTVTTS